MEEKEMKCPNCGFPIMGYDTKTKEHHCANCGFWLKNVEDK